ncbi:hypothetical protein JKA74_20435 [Marivirga sp. S37H4]|uniref:Aerotolerance regulator N-terminal domain-containing protein n=1 Tax=Marivirga aurantiaca TaxID=2802615 RepID=A0A934X375_9BACT|nr:hypothetical protein [Marivirga aurantiaca]MBK6267421.1 hypothetical protein [Marivirga aurantiaca]
MTALSFTNDFNLWHALLLSVAFILISIGEWRKRKRRRLFRIIAVLIGLISLYIIYLKPVTYTEKPLQSIVLLGEETDESYSDSLIKEKNYEIFWWDNQQAILRSGNRKSTTTFTGLDYAIDTLFTVGSIPPINPDYYQHRVNLRTNQPKISINYLKKIHLGEKLKLEVANISNHSLHLAGVLGNDSMKAQHLPAGEKLLKTIQPKTSGHIKGELTINKQEVYHFSTLVYEEQKFVFHLLAETPDFEWRFLKDYLTENGHAVYLKSKISKDKYKSSFSNWPDSLAQQMKSDNPLYVNVLITDMNAWNTLNIKNKNNYIEALKPKHGTLIFRANPNSRMSLQSIHSSLKETVVTGSEIFSLRGINQLNVNLINHFEEVINLHLQKIILAEMSVGIISIQDSYKWQLGGKQEEYESYWSAVLNQLMRTQVDVQVFKTQWPVKYQPFHAQIWSNQSLGTAKIINPKMDTLELKLTNDLIYPEREHLVYFPGLAGWHQLHLKEKSLYYHFYVHEVNTAQQASMELPYEFAYNSYLEQFGRYEDDISSNKKEEPLTFWFFLMFLLSMGFLWMEEKL